MNRTLKEIWACEMVFEGEIQDRPTLSCVPFSMDRVAEYREIYNQCFYPMRKALNIQPYNWYSDDSQISDRSSFIYLLLNGGEMIGSVACRENEIDDLIVKPSKQGEGYGKALLLWAMCHIRDNGHREIVLRVAEWNERALKLYRQTGFIVRKRYRVR